MNKCIWDIIKIKPPKPKPVEGSTWEISGVVDGVDLEGGTITVWLNGFERAETVPIDPGMPGWMTVCGAAFRTTIPRRCAVAKSLDGVVWGGFCTDYYACLSEEDLVEGILSPDDLNPKRGE